MMRRLFAAALTLGAVSAAPAQTVVFEDDFESYADTAALQANTAEYSEVTAEISTDQNHTSGGSQSVLSDAAGEVANPFWTAVTPSVADPVTATFWMYETDSSASGSNGISLAGYAEGTFGSATLNNFVAMGVYTTAPATATEYATRVVFPTSAGWAATTVARVQDAWVEFSVTLDGTDAVFSIDGAEVRTVGYNAYDVNCARLGPFVGGQNVPVYFDDLSVVQGPGQSDVKEWHLY